MSGIIGSYGSPRWGLVTAVAASYGDAGGPLAVRLFADGERLATLSVNLTRPECSQDSRDLPPDCFYAKTWSENEEVAREALASGLFLQRGDLPLGRSGFVAAPVWQVRPVGGGQRSADGELLD